MRNRQTRLLIAKSTMIKWNGDLNDDCSAEWAGLMLRAEWMNDNDGLDSWWWAVHDIEVGRDSVANSYDTDEMYRSGRAAREAAQSAALKYLKSYL